MRECFVRRFLPPLIVRRPNWQPTVTSMKIGLLYKHVSFTIPGSGGPFADLPLGNEEASSASSGGGRGGRTHLVQTVQVLWRGKCGHSLPFGGTQTASLLPWKDANCRGNLRFGSTFFRGLPGAANEANALTNPSSPLGASYKQAAAYAQRGAPQLRDLLVEERIYPPAYEAGQYRVVCPQCSGGSTHEKSLSVKITSDGVAVWKCFRGKCGWEGSVREHAGQNGHLHHVADRRGSSVEPAAGSSRLALAGQGLEDPPRLAEKVLKSPAGRSSLSSELSIQKLDLCELGKRLSGFLEARGISKETIKRNGIAQGNSYCPQDHRKVLALAFPYRRRGQIVNVKYRGPEKKFWQIKGAERILYGLDDIEGRTEIVIVEGEIDKLSVEEAGIMACVSVPDGAPPKVSREGSLPPPEVDKKYEYLWNCREHLERVQRIVLATDADGPGQALAEELARRLGRERCWRVRWPVDPDGTVYKDANEVLLKGGPSALRSCIENAEPYPIRGLFRFGDFYSDIDSYYHLTDTDKIGVPTGWQSVDAVYRVVPGELTVVTGVPNSGKSEWIDALMCNLNQTKGWKFGLCSMENKVRDHARKLLEKYVGKPFFNAEYAGSTQKMTKEEYESGKIWLNNSFYPVRCEDDQLPSIDWVLALARAAVLRHGIRGLVIDPYNELEHQRPASQTETEYVSRMLTKIKRFAQMNDCHVWFVAHPRQLKDWRGEAPNLYDISGSAHFINKCDNGIVIHRYRDPCQSVHSDRVQSDRVQILVRKVRNKTAGRVGEAKLEYDRVTGRYSDVAELRVENGNNSSLTDHVAPAADTTAGSAVGTSTDRSQQKL